ncbi:MAG: lyase family protein [Spirochaetia bacterium]|jgi:adenylosuccinate lyase|nr:lyase family protein [Spirochaetia bacterium]
MITRNIFKNISPLDHRYFLSNKQLFEDLSNYLSEEASIKYCVKVEAALLKTHINMNNHENSKELIKEADSLESAVDPAEVYEEEEKTQHNIRALVNVIKEHISDSIKPYVHLGATSVDILDTASSLKIRDVTRNILLKLLIEIEELLIRIAEKEAETPQVGRTHGQHAVPITFGFAIAEYVSRLGKSIIKIKGLSDDLRGKLAGAVGAYNSTSLIVKDPVQMEEDTLSYLSLKPSEHSTQLIEPEYLLRLLLEMNTAFGVIANLADDLRHLQRSEITELREMFTETQVGSSTMPQKRNPWNSEHVKSLWKAFCPRVITFYMDQISEHQRDLSNSASSRFVADYIAGFAAALNRIKKVLSTLYVDKKKMKDNIVLTGDLVLAEAAYILLSCSGESDAHEKIRKITLECEKTGEKLSLLLMKDKEIWEKITNQLKKTTGHDSAEFFANPELYRGQSVNKAKALAEKYKREMLILKEKIV